MKDNLSYGNQPYKRGRFLKGGLNKKQVVQTISFSIAAELKSEMAQATAQYKERKPGSSQSDFIREAIQYFITNKPY